MFHNLQKVDETVHLRGPFTMYYPLIFILWSF